MSGTDNKRKIPHSSHVGWKQKNIFHCWAETKKMVDAGYIKFWERRGMTPPNSTAKSNPWN